MADSVETASSIPNEVAGSGIPGETQPSITSMQQAPASCSAEGGSSCSIQSESVNQAGAGQAAEGVGSSNAPSGSAVGDSPESPVQVFSFVGVASVVLLTGVYVSYRLCDRACSGVVGALSANAAAAAQTCGVATRAAARADVEARQTRARLLSLIRAVNSKQLDGVDTPTRRVGSVKSPVRMEWSNQGWLFSSPSGNRRLRVMVEDA